MMKAISREKPSGDEPEVTKEDQKYINEFSRLHAKNKAIDGDIKKIKDILESLKDAKDAVEESFGEPIKLNIGESFILVKEEEANDYIEAQQKKYEDQRSQLIAKYEKNKARLDDLKVILYTKFGKSIHLEEE